MYIEKNIPVPKHRHGSITDMAKKMEIGDSVLVEDSAVNNRSVVESLRRAIRRFGGKSSYKKVDGGVRVWRVG